jgi:hypothetical protein
MNRLDRPADLPGRLRNAVGAFGYAHVTIRLTSLESARPTLAQLASSIAI